MSMKARAGMAGFALAFALLVVGGGRAAAIETVEFGLTPVRATAERQSIHLSVRPGSSARADVRVWNKTDKPLRLQLSAVPAEIRAGEAALGGDDPAARWATLSEAAVDLGPKAERRVAVTVKAPKDLGKEQHTFAVLARPEAGPGPQPAVVQQLALMVYVERAGGGIGLGLIVWVAAALTVAVALAVGLRVARRR